MHMYTENHAIFDYRIIIAPNLRSMDEGTINTLSLNVVFTGVFVWGGVAIL
jgi:hypothetical protein